ncbi:deoxyfructose oxidoreductase [Halobacillus andaensis]|uniref:Deoxyfructose oxidoreductase n=1 Tax=Halobacillus andaensis TaxID=1176239 RepID=A0A917B4R4_HALAA|nr:Gfo/Idh/MocA family oxidoreductase [Halobacillus andaensis]MBP2004602.1 putative dehydrogenase [Halobacillus andaensis]GGF20386.1 deoxyfructose oxidoreductase [Halobacillus andaensis]
MKWGILSAANIAKKALIPAIQRTEGAEAFAIASQSGKAREFAEQFEIPQTYESYESLLADPNVEAVYIPLPNHLHKEWTIKAAEAGKHVLCEKPAAIHQSDVNEMIEACNQNGVYFLEAFMYQFHPQHQKVKELIDSGVIGDVSLVRASFSFYFYRSNYNIRLDAGKGGGALWDVGCYGVHSALHLIDQEVSRVTATAKLDEEYHVDTTSSASLLLENGVIVQVDCSFDAAARNTYEVIGSEGVITVHDAYRPDKKNHEGKITVENEQGVKEFVEQGDQYSLQVENFMKAIVNKKSLETYHKETIRYLGAMEAIQEKIKK